MSRWFRVGSAEGLGGLPRLALTHPLGLNRPGAEEHVRFIRSADFVERSLSVLAEVRPDALVWLMKGDARTVLDAIDAAAADSLAGLDGAAPLGMIAFDPTARRELFSQPHTRRAVDRLRWTQTLR